MYANHSKIDSEHDWEDLYNHLMNMRATFTLMMNKMFM